MIKIPDSGITPICPKKHSILFKTLQQPVQIWNIIYVIDLIHFAINIIIKYRIVFPGL